MIKIVTPAAGDVVTLSELKEHLHILNDLEDDYLSALLAAGTSFAEEFLNRYLLETEVLEYYDCFYANIVELMRAPVSELVSVKYLDTDGNEQTLDVDTDFWFDSISEPSRIQVIDSWPTTQTKRMNSVYIQYKTGYGTAADVPMPIKHAIKLICGAMYEKREDSVMRVYTSYDLIASRNLLYPYRLNKYQRV